MGAEVHRSFEGLERDWNDLAARSNVPPWYRPGWLVPWWTAFGRGRLEIVAVRRGGRLAAVLPLARRRVRLDSLANYHTPAFGMVAEDPAAADELADALVGRSAPSVALRFVDPEEAALHRRAAARADRSRVLVRALERSPYVPLDPGWSAYEASLDGHLRAELRRRSRRLAAEGPVSFTVHESEVDLDDVLDEGLAVEAAGWKGEAGTAIASAAPIERFYREVAHWAACEGWLRVGLLRVGRRTAAFDLAIEFGRAHYLLKTGFDPAFAAMGPGLLLRREMLARAFGAGLETYEFLGRDEPWKLRWARRTRERLLVQVFAPGVVGFAEWLVFAYGRPVARWALAQAARA